MGHKHRQIRWISPPEGLGSYHAILGDMSMTAMPKITSLRKHLEALKTPYIVEAVQGLADDDRALVFCEYRESIATMQAALADAGVGCVTLTGSDSGQKRQQAIDAFQNDPRIKVFLGTTGAAGVGITLTAANYVFFASLPWNPPIMHQAEDRAYRLGQKRDVTVLVPMIAGTVDEQVLRKLDAKAQTEKELIEAVRTELQRTPVELATT